LLRLILETVEEVAKSFGSILLLVPKNSMDFGIARDLEYTSVEMFKEGTMYCKELIQFSEP